MKAEGLIVSEAIKFPVAKQTARSSYRETQTHGYEVDLAQWWTLTHLLHVPRPRWRQSLHPR